MPDLRLRSVRKDLMASRGSRAAGEDDCTKRVGVTHCKNKKKDRKKFESHSMIILSSF